MNFLSKLGQFLSGAQAQASAAADSATQAVYVLSGLLLIADVLLFFIYLSVSGRRRS